MKDVSRVFPSFLLFVFSFFWKSQSLSSSSSSSLNVSTQRCFTRTREHTRRCLGFAPWQNRSPFEVGGGVNPSKKKKNQKKKSRRRERSNMENTRTRIMVLFLRRRVRKRSAESEKVDGKPQTKRKAWEGSGNQQEVSRDKALGWHCFEETYTPPSNGDG